ncbi:hypothetical protein [Trinickia mobilis]|uniref:hypothetical protein n=1 Tax=Trinickia mobilis TaxID=2816356 RepID=UPI001A8E4EF3|nr:hypothetical protein [Trinickia mobilis]
MVIPLEKIMSNFNIEKNDIARARVNNERVGIAYGDSGKADTSFRWTPLRMIAHDQTGEAY